MVQTLIAHAYLSDVLVQPAGEGGDIASALILLLVLGSLLEQDEGGVSADALSLAESSLDGAVNLGDGGLGVLLGQVLPGGGETLAVSAWTML